MELLKAIPSEQELRQVSGRVIGRYYSNMDIVVLEEKYARDVFRYVDREYVIKRVKRAGLKRNADIVMDWNESDKTLFLGVKYI